MTNQTKTELQNVQAKVAHLSDHRKELLREIEDVDATLSYLKQKRSQLSTEGGEGC